MTNLFNRFVKWYQFDVTDIIAFMYTLCVMGIVGLQMNMNLLFTVAVVISFVSVLKSGRLNLLIINAMFVILNVYNLIQ